MNSFNTVKEYLDYLHDPNIDYMSITNNFANIDKSCFWVAANIQGLPDSSFIFDLEPDIKHDELVSETQTPSEMKYHREHNFGNGYDRHKADSFHFVADLLGFEDPFIVINNQPPGALMGRHVDTITCYLNDKDENVLNMPFDNKLRQPLSSKPIYRCFVALADWKPGQIVNFEPHFWTEWEKGDVVFFDWQNTPHGTANIGSHNRPFLKITGTLKNDSWVIKAKESNQSKKFIYND